MSFGNSFAIRSSIDLKGASFHSFVDFSSSDFPVVRESDLSQMGEVRNTMPDDMKLEQPDELKLVIPIENFIGPINCSDPAVKYVLVVVKMNWSGQMSVDEIKHVQESLCPRPKPSPDDVMTCPTMVNFIDHVVGTTSETIARVVTAINSGLERSPTLRSFVQTAMEHESDSATIRIDGGETISTIDAPTATRIFSEASEAYQLFALLERIPGTNTELLDRARLLSMLNRRASPKDIAYFISSSISFATFYREVEYTLRMKSFELPDSVSQAIEVANPFSRATATVLPLTPAQLEDLRNKKSTYAPEGPDPTDVRSWFDVALSEPGKYFKLYTDPKDGKLKYSNVVYPEKLSPAMYNSFRRLILDFTHLSEDERDDAIQVAADTAKKLKAASTTNTIPGARQLPAGGGRFYSELLYTIYQAMKVKTPGASIAQKIAFGYARTLVAKKGLYIDSEEVVRVAKDDVNHYFPFTPVDAALIESAFNAIKHPELHDVLFVLSAISYLKSGHNATAAGLAGTAISLTRAMGITIDEATASVLMPYGTYFGTHAKSMRLYLATLFKMHAAGQLSFAISRRLSPTPPGSAAATSAMIFLHALNRARYFTAMQQQEEFNELVRHYDEWYEGRMFRAPYASYLYGKSKPEDTLFNQRMAKWFSLCSAIPGVMPSSSLRFATALSREATSASQNDLLGPVLVGAYVGGVTSAVTRSVRESLERGTMTLK